MENKCIQYLGVIIYNSLKWKEHVTFTLVEVSIGFVCKHLLQLKTSKAIGLDGLPLRLLKDRAVNISHILTYSVNLSLKTKCIPQDCGSMPRLFFV